MIPKFNIVITGGNGRFGKLLKKKFNSKNLFYPDKKKLNILSEQSIEKYLKKVKPKILIHLAGLSRPMSIHQKNICKSIDLNIIGTANAVKICKKNNIKLIYFSKIMFTRVKKEITKNQTLSFQVIIMHGQN